MDEYKNYKNDEEKIEDEYRFVKQVIKKKSKRPKDVLIRLACIVGGAILFGVVAAFVFVRFLPVFQPEKEAAADPIEFEEDTPQEVQPAKNKNIDATVTPSPTPEADSEVGEDSVTVPEVTVPESPITEYTKMYDEMKMVAQNAMRAVVTVTGITTTEDWFQVHSESTKQSSGVIVANSNGDLYILTEYSAVESVERVVITFNNGAIADGRYQMHDPNTGLTVLKVAVDDLETETKANMAVAKLGNSFTVSQGEAVIAIGSPMGYSSSVVYGQITSTTNTLSLYDKQYHIFTTNMLGNEEGSGIIINLKGEVVSVMSQGARTEDLKNIIVGLPISQLKPLIENLSNGKPVASIGIKGQNVTDEVANQTGMPKGVYVTSMKSDSPAFVSGIKNGDIIVKYNDISVENMVQYAECLSDTNPGAIAELTVMRMSSEGYREFTFKVVTETR